MLKYQSTSFSLYLESRPHKAIPRILSLFNYNRVDQKLLTYRYSGLFVFRLQLEITSFKYNAQVVSVIPNSRRMESVGKKQTSCLWTRKMPKRNLNSNCFSFFLR